MKTTRYTLLAAALLLAASCANDPVEDIINPSAPGTALPGGTFVIDYTAGMEGADTRNELDANQRIQSLDYLIYQSTENGTYTLLKKKTIPGIGPNTKWPLNRDNMTWEQREALKDTLSTDKNYKMVFVANADDDIWDPTGTSDFHALQNVEINSDFNDGRLVLPPNGQFEDDNMYYMDTLAIDGKDYATDEDKTATLTITLQRMINKVEVKLADDVVNGIRTEGSVDEYVESKLGEYYDSYYANTNTKTGKLYEIAGTYLKKLDDNLDTEGSSDLEVRYRDTKKFQDTYLGQTGKENFVSSINTCTESTCTIDNPYCVRQTFIKDAKPLFHCDWNEIVQIHICYKKESYPQSIDFNKSTKAESNKDNYIIANREKENSYIFYTFGNITNGGELNKIQSMQFYKQNEDNIEMSFEIKNIEIVPGGQITGGNNSFVLSYNPIKEENINILSVNEENEETYFAFTRNAYNLQSLGWTWDDFELDRIIWDQNDMIDWINDGLRDSDIEGTYDNMTLSLNLPKIEIINPWSTTSDNKTESNP